MPPASANVVLAKAILKGVLGSSTRPPRPSTRPIVWSCVARGRAMYGPGKAETMKTTESIAEPDESAATKLNLGAPTSPAAGIPYNVRVCVLILSHAGWPVI